MTQDANLAIDESRKMAQHEAVKNEIRGEVQSEIARNAEGLAPDQQAQVGALADQLKEKAVHEVVKSEADLERARFFARVSQIVDYAFFVLYGIISLEILLELLGARESAGFKKLIDTLAAPALVPFRGLLPDPGHGPFRLMLSYIMALVVYILLHVAITGLLRMFVHRKVAV